MAARNPKMPSERDIRVMLDVRRGLRTDPVNTRRRARYREQHKRSCGGCTKDLTGTGLRHCAPCQLRREAEMRGRVRTCAGSAGSPCDTDVTGTRKQRCLMHELLHRDEVRLARNERRRRPGG
jgi:hypothetical protein